MDPVTAFLNAYAETVGMFKTFYEGASADQKVQIVQNWIDFDKFWRDVWTRVFTPPK